MFAPVEPVHAERPTFGSLVAAAITPQDNTRWEDGLAWRPERCPQARTFDPCGGTFEDPPVGDGDADVVYYRPPAFRVEDRCSTRSGRSPEYAARVRRQADAVTSFMVARELQNGDLSALNPYSTPEAADQTNAYLAMTGGTTVAGTWDIAAGLGALEQEARQVSLGMNVYIHMPIRLAVALDARGVLISEGALLRTRTGARVVADAGYSGRGPDVAGTSEVQTVTVTGAPTGGTFTLTFSGQTTAGIAFNATALAVQNALNALSNLDGVTVTGGPGPGTPWTVTFPATMGNVAQMTDNPAGLTGGTSPDVTVVTTTPGVAPSVAAGLWMYATGPVVVRLGEIITDSLIDHQVNEVVHTADRLFAATFDPCSLHSVQVTDPAPTP